MTYLPKASPPQAAPLASIFGPLSHGSTSSSPDYLQEGGQNATNCRPNTGLASALKASPICSVPSRCIFHICQVLPPGSRSFPVLPGTTGAPGKRSGQLLSHRHTVPSINIYGTPTVFWVLNWEHSSVFRMSNNTLAKSAVRWGRGGEVRKIGKLGAAECQGER